MGRAGRKPAHPKPQRDVVDAIYALRMGMQRMGAGITIEIPDGEIVGLVATGLGLQGL